MLAGPGPGAAQTPQVVRPGWQYIPAGVTEGQSFRLLFITSTTTTATSSDIADYNTFVQAAANNNAALRPFKNEFRALLSTATADARDNTATTGSGVPIYWLLPGWHARGQGQQVADNYADLYDGSWDSRYGRTEEGRAYGDDIFAGVKRQGPGVDGLAGRRHEARERGGRGECGRVWPYGPGRPGLVERHGGADGELSPLRPLADPHGRVLYPGQSGGEWV